MLVIRESAGVANGLRPLDTPLKRIRISWVKLIDLNHLNHSKAIFRNTVIDQFLFSSDKSLKGLSDFAV